MRRRSSFPFSRRLVARVAASCAPLLVAPSAAPLSASPVAAGPGLTAPHGQAPRSAEAPRARLRLIAVARLRATPPPDTAPPVARDVHDPEILSPKSARFSADGGTLWINALEGGTTVAYAWPSLEKRRSIVHRFRARDAALFAGATTVFGQAWPATLAPGADPNVFVGRPVESALSVDGRWLFVPYYRRSFDRDATGPSALAVVDAASGHVVRVLPTGPIPKYVAPSPDGRLLAVTHWGDNTVALLDVSSGDPARFAYVRRLVVERVLPQAGLAGTDRDRTCGFCLRGTVFTADARTLLVARMGGGGIAGFDVADPAHARYLGTVTAVPPTPRHLELAPDGRVLYASSNVAGAVSRAPTAAVVAALRAAGGRRVPGPAWRSVRLGAGARTIALDPSGRVLLAALNGSAAVVAVDAERMTELARVAVDPFAVGLAVAPDGRHAVVTSQGRRIGGRHVGGNSVTVVRLEWDSGGVASARGARRAGAAPGAR